MKECILKKLLVLMLSLMIVAAATAGNWVTINDSEKPLDVRVLDNDGSKTVMKFSVNGYELDNVLINGKYFSAVKEVRKESMIEEKGYPRLPRINRSIIIPNDGIMNYKILSMEFIEVKDIDITPSKGHFSRNIDPESVPYTFADVYGKDAFYPENLVDLRDPYILRDFRGMVVELNAFRYNPVTRTLRIYTDVTVEVSKTAPGGVNILERNTAELKIDRQFAKLYQRHFINANPMDYIPLLEDGDMMIICYDNFIDEMAPLVDWKNQKGQPTYIVPVSEAGNSATAIKNYIQNVYNNSDLTYVLLVGDNAQVPAWSTSSWTGPSDPNYGLLAGNDAYPEIFVGRFSAENIGHVQTQVERTVNYEKFPESGAEWYQHALGIASNQGPGHNGEYDNQHISIILNQLLRYTFTYVDSVYDFWGTQAMISGNLNQAGISAIYYCGHGSTTSWSTTNYNNGSVNNLTNTGMLPHILSVACNNGTFSTTTCFAEAWLRATHNTTGEPTGAIATYMSYISQSWSPPMDAEDEAVDLMTENEMFTYGGACFNGSNLMIDLNGGQGETEAKSWTIFGDPSLELRNAAAFEMTVSHDAGMNVGLTNFDVSVADLTGPMAGARVCAMNEEIYAVGETDANGNVTLTFNPAPTIPGSFTLTVTGLNAVPYIQDVDLIAPDGPYVVFDNLEIEDVTGNDDGMLNPGETAGLTVTVENVGTQSAENVEVTITSSNTYVTIIDGSEIYGDITANSTATITDAFEIQLAANTPQGEMLQFTLTAVSGTNTWESGFTIESTPNVSITLTPATTPITIPANGGSFDYTVDVGNDDPVEVNFDIWSMVTLPDGSEFGPLFNVNKTFAANLSVSRDRSQSVPGNAPAGVYTFDAYAGDYPDEVWAESYFDFEKSAVDNGGSFISEWVSFGESFDDITGTSAAASPSDFGFYNAYPNPFNPTTLLSYNLPESGNVKLVIFDIQGRETAKLFEGMQTAGVHQTSFNAQGLASGIYFAHLSANGKAQIQKLLLIK